jgi:hypothetical protein
LEIVKNFAKKTKKIKFRKKNIKFPKMFFYIKTSSKFPKIYASWNCIFLTRRKIQVRLIGCKARAPNINLHEFDYYVITKKKQNQQSTFTHILIWTRHRRRKIVSVNCRKAQKVLNSSFFSLQLVYIDVVVLVLNIFRSKFDVLCLIILTGSKILTIILSRASSLISKCLQQQQRSNPSNFNFPIAFNIDVIVLLLNFIGPNSMFFIW